ncbi:hypothetical protein STA3757_00980 [Stanieria sp. NIES-3757]|nr:hypothetical protein STA3757_00980 [Stanieria sp. NIES-3757]
MGIQTDLILIINVTGYSGSFDTATTSTLFI